MNNLSDRNGDGNHNLLEAALDYHKRGLSIIPVIGKRPGIRSWKQFQNRRPKEKELKKWFANPKITGVAVICGPVSGYLIIRDFDKPEAYHQWAAQHPELAAALPTVQTAKGFHVYFCSANGQRTIVLADGELRGEGGYCLLPPSRHPDGGEYRWMVPLPEGAIPVIDIATSGLATAYSLTKQTQHSRHTHACVKSVADSIRETLPTGPKQRNGKLFDLARMLKAIVPDASNSALREIVRDWHKQALATIRTKDFTTTWMDFSSAWERVKVPAGTPSWQQMVEEGKDMPTPAAGLEYDSEPMRLLVALCATLSRHYGGNPFYLSCRKAGEAIGVSHETANAMLNTLRFDGVLELVEKGQMKGTASTWRYIGD